MTQAKTEPHTIRQIAELLVTGDRASVTSDKPRKRKSRASKSRKDRGVVKTLTIELFSQAEVDQLAECFDRQAWTAERQTFYREALLFGAKFRANAGAGPKA